MAEYQTQLTSKLLDCKGQLILVEHSNFTKQLALCSESLLNALSNCLLILVVDIHGSRTLLDSARHGQLTQAAQTVTVGARTGVSGRLDFTVYAFDAFVVNLASGPKVKKPGCSVCLESAQSGTKY